MRVAAIVIALVILVFHDSGIRRGKDYDAPRKRFRRAFAQLTEGAFEPMTWKSGREESVHLGNPFITRDP